MRKFILETIFVKQKQKNKPEQIITKAAQSEAVAIVDDTKLVGEDFQTMWEITKYIKADLFVHKWRFEGDINNYTAPKLLTTLKWYHY